MDRQYHKKHVPVCPRHTGIVDQYMWSQKDTTKYMCYNGISHPIYDCKGWVNYTLPLEMYPKVNKIHPQIAMVRRPHLQYRGNPRAREHFQHPQAARSCPSRREFILASKRTDPGKLPSPHGYASGRSGCNSCS